MPGRGSERTATVLLLDQNREIGFALRTCLAKQPRLRLLEAGSQRQAAELLQDQLVDVVVACVQSPDSDGLPLLQQVRQQDHLASLPFLLVADDDRVASKVKALQLGATDYVARPLAMAEVVARIDAAVRQQRRSARSLRRDGRLSGDLQTIAFTDLVHLLQIGRRSGTLTLLTEAASGQALFVDGQVYHATFGSMQGEEAFYRLVFEARGQFEFMPCGFDLRTVRNTVALTTTTLLVEAARRLDSWRRDHPGAAPDPVQPLPATTATLQPAMVGCSDDATRLQRRLDTDAGASWQLLRREQLPQFTAAAAEERSCLVLLVADLPAAIAAAGSAAAPVGPELLQQALAAEPKLLALRWHDGAARLDLLLLDQDCPGSALDHLWLQPQALLLAPRGGDWSTLPLPAQHELAGLVERLQPLQLLGLGPLADALPLLQQRTAASVHCLPTPLQHWGQLRAALLATLSRWAALEPAPV